MQRRETIPDDSPIEPCEHMKERVSALADGSLKGPGRWYTQWHASHCPKCGAALRRLRALLEQLKSLRSAPQQQVASRLSADRRERLAEEMAKAERPSDQGG